MLAPNNFYSCSKTLQTTHLKQCLRQNQITVPLTVRPEVADLHIVASGRTAAKGIQMQKAKLSYQRRNNAMPQRNRLTYGQWQWSCRMQCCHPQSSSVFHIHVGWHLWPVKPLLKPPLVSWAPEEKWKIILSIECHAARTAESVFSQENQLLEMEECL